MTDERKPSAEEFEAISANLTAAAEASNESEEFVDCPTCGHKRRAFVIVDDKCDSCRTREQASNIKDRLGWPEVRHRRNIMIGESDHTQLSDRTEEVRQAFFDWRQQLRDVTDEEDALKAWYKLDELTASRPKG